MDDIGFEDGSEEGHNVTMYVKGEFYRFTHWWNKFFFDMKICKKCIFVICIWQIFNLLCFEINRWWWRCHKSTKNPSSKTQQHHKIMSSFSSRSRSIKSNHINSTTNINCLLSTNNNWSSSLLSSNSSTISRLPIQIGQKWMKIMIIIIYKWNNDTTHTIS